jgi:hypothetical protein
MIIFDKSVFQWYGCLLTVDLPVVSVSGPTEPMEREHEYFGKHMERKKRRRRP